MEVILLPMRIWTNEEIEYCFNPCFYGSYSFTLIFQNYVRKVHLVLILVFMEVILLQEWSIITPFQQESFNPCFYGSYSFTLIES